MILSLERNSYFVNEATGFVEVCAVLNGLGEESVITATILTEGNSATGKLNENFCMQKHKHNYLFFSCSKKEFLHGIKSNLCREHFTTLCIFSSYRFR